MFCWFHHFEIRVCKLLHLTLNSSRNTNATVLHVNQYACTFFFFLFVLHFGIKMYSNLHCSLSLSLTVLKPLVEVLSDPDYINQMLLAQLEHREQMNEHHKKAYTYAPSYEEFIKLISSSSDIDFLKQLR